MRNKPITSSIHLGILARTAWIVPFVACATTEPSSHLVEARQAYQQAVDQDADELAPDHLLAAHQMLEKAEAAHEDEAQSEQELHFSYLAARKAQAALVHSQIAKSDREASTARTAYQKQLETERESANTKLSEMQRNYQSTQEQLSATQQRLSETEKQAQAAIDSLKEIASVKAEQQETVITLSGAVLFKTGQAELLPIAEQQLGKVAEALKQQDVKKTIVIEGHTDAQGSNTFNQQLSQKRAEAVRSFLVGQGVKPDLVQAVGRGEEEPIATNDNPEGRANNRRVEIIVKGDEAMSERSSVD